MTDATSHLRKPAVTGDLLFSGPRHLQYAAICYRLAKTGNAFEILVVTGRDSGRWMLPRGWPIEGRRPYQVAEREAFEEAGSRARQTRSRSATTPIPSNWMTAA